MQLTLTDDQVFFRDTTRRFLATECPLTVVRSLASSARGFDAGYWRQGAELGWTSLLVPEELGGGSVSGNGVADLTIVGDLFGHHVAPGPLVPTNVVASTLARVGTDEQRSWLPGLLSGEVVTAWVGADPAWSARTPVSATADGEGYVLDGTSGPVEAAAEADQLLVTARTDTGLVQCLVPASSPGITITALQSIDLVRRFARVELDHVAVAAPAVVGAPDTASDDVERQLQHALVIQAAEMVGAAQRTFDFTVEWAFDRYSFGRPLASYQELKHRFADMKMWLEASHALADALAGEVQDGLPSAAETASATKAYLGDRLVALVQDCVQMHGGIGLTAEHDIHLFVRRTTADRSSYGTPAEHRQRIAALAIGERAA